MRTKVSKVTIGGNIYYLAQYKKHWWNRWTYIRNSKTNVPQLFRTYVSAELIAETGKNFNPENIFE